MHHTLSPAVYKQVLLCTGSLRLRCCGRDLFEHTFLLCAVGHVHGDAMVTVGLLRWYPSGYDFRGFARQRRGLSPLGKIS